MYYSQYRPQKFADLVGSEHIVSAITSALNNGKPGHAYFFTGSRGIGKTTTARLLAKALNCENPKNKVLLSKSETPEYISYEPCGRCASCEAIQKGASIDLIEIDAASNRGIDNIRELKDNVKLSPSSSKNKIYIIDEVHMLTTEASNALLKTLEEPPANVYFILCTTNPEKVLDTIKSRCIQFKFTRPSIDEIIVKLRKITKDQKYEISDEKLKRIAIISKGAYREAETLLEQLINGDEYTLKILNEQESDYYEFVRFLAIGDRGDAIRFVHKVYNSGVSLEDWTEKLIQYIRTLMLEKIGVKGVDNTFELNDVELELIKEIDENYLKEMLTIFSKAMEEFKYTVVPTLPLEIAVVEAGRTDKSTEIKTSDIKPEQTYKTPANNNKNPDKKVESYDDGSKKGIEKKKTIDRNNEVDNSKEEVVKTKIGDTVRQAKEDSKHKEVKAFPYQKLIENIKPFNHSIHVMLHSCEVAHFDGQKLLLTAYYSFHKERIMSRKIRDIIEKAATELYGAEVIINCDLSDKKPESRKLTDRNIKITGSKGVSDDTADVFEKIFGDEMEEV